MTEFAGIDPRLARCILASWNLSCVYEVVTIVSMLHVRQIWSPGGKKSREARSQFAVKEGDLITYLNVWRGWEENRRGSSWAYKNYIRHKNLCRALEIRNELLQTVHSLECMRDNLLLRRDITLAETEERIRNTCRALAHAAATCGDPISVLGPPPNRLLRPGIDSSWPSRCKVDPKNGKIARRSLTCRV